MSRTLYLRGAIVWLAILLVASVNGALRELVLRRFLDETVARATSTVLLCLFIALVARLAIRWIGPARADDALRIGVLWLVLTLAFEFLAGRYLFGNSWDLILSEYDVTKGRIWVLVPIVTLFAPVWAWRCWLLSVRQTGTMSLLFALGASAGACAGGEGARDSAPPDTATPGTSWTVGIESVGPIAYGMTLAEAAAAVDDSLAARPPSDDCAFVRFPQMPAGMQLMTEGGRITRVDVTDGEGATDRGARLGMSAGEVQSLYGNALEVTPHKYDSAGRYLVFVPHEPVDSVRIVFETDGNLITRFRAGLLPAVEYVEGCG